MMWVCEVLVRANVMWVWLLLLVCACHKTWEVNFSANAQKMHAIGWSIGYVGGVFMGGAYIPKLIKLLFEFWRWLLIKLINVKFYEMIINFLQTVEYTGHL